MGGRSQRYAGRVSSLKKDPFKKTLSVVSLSKKSNCLISTIFLNTSILINPNVDSMFVGRVITIINPVGCGDALYKLVGRPDKQHCFEFLKEGSVLGETQFLTFSISYGFCVPLGRGAQNFFSRMQPNRRKRHPSNWVRKSSCPMTSRAVKGLSNSSCFYLCPP